MSLKFNKHLTNRFASDYKLPIPITFNEEFFFYYLDMLEEKYGARTKYEKLCKVIKEQYDNNADTFLHDYYNVRENIIQTVTSNPAFIEFNEKLDMSQFAVKTNISSNSVYNGQNKGKTFLSIDLKNANFQALKWIDKNIVLSANTYEEFIGKFTNLDYIKDSKYTRQVVFGKMNPKRHITVEKFLINNVKSIVEKLFNDTFKLVSLTTDELVYEINDSLELDLLSLMCFNIKKIVFEKLGLDIHITPYKLTEWQLLFKKSGDVSKTFYVKTNLFDKNNTELICVPLPFFPIIYKLFYSKKLAEKDYYFNYEGMLAKIEEEFILIEN